MSDHQSFQRFTAMTVIMSFLFAVASIVLQGIPINFSPDIAANPALWLVVRADGASLFRRGMILDMLEHYLPLLPIALFRGVGSDREIGTGFSSIPRAVWVTASSALSAPRSWRLCTHR